jgi:cytochrome c553
MIHPLLHVALAIAGSGSNPAGPGGDGFESARDIIESRCLSCHGGEGRESGLSFADAATFEAGGARGPAVRSDDVDRSRLLEVISYRNPDLAMPPSGRLPEDERATLEAWVRAGAPWPEGDAGRLADPAAHPVEAAVMDIDADWWAYGPLEPVAVPAGEHEHAVDALLAVRRDAAGLPCAGAAEPLALLRRASFDLTGLPPTVAEREAFQGDVEARGFEAAWASLLDRLFESPHYGEHQARHWLDLVRYGETNGYERDNPKQNMWRYRDWVVRAFDADLPYDQFVKHQFAGDEYADQFEDSRDRDQAMLATGFFRLGVWDDEPVDRPQAAADGRADVVDTFSQVVMATTMGCARCHDHKADPITQKEYYELTAHVRGVRHYGGRPEADLIDRAQDGVRHVSERDADLVAVEQEIVAEAHRLGLDAPAPGAQVDVLIPDARSGEHRWRYRFGEPVDGWEMPGFNHQDWKEGKAGFGRRGTPKSVVRTDWHEKFIQLRTTFRLEEIPEALRLTLHYDDDVRVYINGLLVLERTGYIVDYGTHQLPQAARDALVVGRNVVAVSCLQDFGGQYIDIGLDTGCDPNAEGGPVALLEAAAAERADDAELERGRDLLARRVQLKGERVNKPYPAQVVREVGSRPPAQHINLRGSVHALADEVGPGVPLAWVKGTAGEGEYAAPQNGPDGAPTSGRRRALVEWIFSDGVHLAARVEANRTWQFLFGRGLCRSTGDFGRLGDRPTHPELLDHLAAELIERGWSRKSLQRFIMESEAYRMATVGPDEALEADPRNDLFWRFNPRRLTAEEVRDAMLAASGELNLRRHGPSVFPPLPKEVLATSSRPGAAWGRSSKEDSVRRSVYIHVKRSLREPLLAVLDQPDPDMPCPERFPTNVPTQALLTLNGEFSQVRAEAFAASLSDQQDLRAALAEAMERALSRTPDGAELDRAEALVEALVEEHGFDQQRALGLFALGLFNRNEFTWLD